MVATRKRTTSANTELTTDQLIATVEQDNQKLKSSLRARESQIGFLQRELAQATQTIAEMRENSAAQVEAQAARIALLESTNETLKAQLRKRMDSAPAKRAEELEHQLASQYQDLRQAIDQATALACQRLEEIERLKKQVEKQAEENIRLKQETRRAEKNESTMLDRMRKAEEQATSHYYEEWGKAMHENRHLQKLLENGSRKKLLARIASLEQYEAMFACKVYADRPTIDSTEAALMLENQRLKESMADLANDANGMTTQAKQIIAHLKAEKEQTAERVNARLSELEAQLERAQTQAEQNAHIAEEEHTQVTTLLEENARLRTTLAEREDLQGDTCQECAVKDRRIHHLEEVKQENNRCIMRLQNEIQWRDSTAASQQVEATTKLVAIAMRTLCQGKEESYTPVYTEDIAKACGLNRQAAGRHMNHAVDWGLFGGYRTEEKAIVHDARLGQREITKKILNVVPTELLQHPEDWKRGDGKQHGGAGRRCKNCGAENSLRTIPHTVCLACGTEDVFYPDEAQAALDRTPLQPEDSQAAVAEAVAIVTQTSPAPAPVEPVTQEDSLQQTDVHLEHQSHAPDYATKSMTIARQKGFPILNLPGIDISAGSAAWSHWMWMSHPTDEQIRSVHEALTKKSSAVQDELHLQPNAPAPWDTPCNHCGGTETIYDPDNSGRRVCACYIHPERRKQPETKQAEHTHKVVDLASGRIVEVQE